MTLQLKTAMQALVIRDAQEGDLQAIVAIQDASPNAAQWPQSYYGNALNDRGRLVLVSEQEQSKILGFVVASIAVKEWEVENIAVTAQAQRRGIGRALMNALIYRARRANASEIRQEIRASNKAAQKLGLSLGFIQEGRRSNYYREPVEDALLFKHLLV